jgi:hypothetical protein
MGYGGTNSDGETTSFLTDMRDGGGRGTSGPTFVADDRLGILGKLISGTGNTMGGPGGAPFTIGGEDNRIPSPQGTSIGRDIIDGGGLGYAGDFHRGLPLISMFSNITGAPFGRDNVTIGKMLQDLETNDEFLDSFVGDTDTTMRKMRVLSPARFQQLKQQHLSKNFNTIQPSYYE